MPCSSSVEMIARRSAYRNPGAVGSRSSAITNSPCSRAAPSSPSCAGPAPRTRRRLPVAAPGPSTRPHCRGTTRWCARARPRTTSSPASRAGAPPSRSSRCGGRPGRGARRRCTLSERGLAEQVENLVRDLRHRDVDARRDVDHLADDRVVGRDDRLDRLGVVVHVEPVAARMAVAVDRQRLVGERLRDEARDHLLRVLPRPVVVERADDHDREAVRDEVRVGEAIGSGLRRGVRAARVERVLLVHGLVERRAVDLAGREEDEALDRLFADRVEQDLRAFDVRGHELGRAGLDRLLHVRLGGCVHDHVHFRDDLADEIGVADVAVHERVPLVRRDRGEVVHAARVGERVEGDDLVRGRLQDVADEVRRDESRAAGDEYALRLHGPQA